MLNESNTIISIWQNYPGNKVMRWVCRITLQQTILLQPTQGHAALE